MSIRSKLTLLLTAFITLSVGTVSAWFLNAQARQLRLASDERLELLAESAAQMGAEAALAKDPFMLLTYLAFLRKGNPELVRCRAWLDGRWVDVGGAAPESAGGVEGLRVLRRDAAKEPGVELSFDEVAVRRRDEEALGRVRGEVARIALAVLLLGLAAAVVLGRSMTRRVSAIQETMERAAEGKWGLQAEAGGRDEIGRLARAFNAMSRQLADLEERKRAFVASVTHELRSPLGAIEACVRDLTRSEPGLSEDARKNLAGIESHASRLGHFVGNLLEMAKIQRGKLDYEPAAGDLRAVVEDVGIFFRPRAREAGLKLSAALPEGPLPLTFDQKLVTQVLANLVSNAIKFTAAPGEIRLALRRVEDGAECSVSDTGVGIDAAALERVFMPFERVPNPMKATGTGLGLAISKSIIEQHGGRIGAESRPGKGSRFWFTLPLAAMPAERFDEPSHAKG